MRITTVSILALALASAAQAKPEGPRAFCAEYPNAPACFGKLASCSQCHDGAPVLNAFGGEVQMSLYTQVENYTGDNYEQKLGEALRAIEDQDPDFDGVVTLEEIMLATDPGDPGSVFTGYPLPEGTIPNVDFELGNWDAKFAFKRMMITYCGHSPSYEDMQDLANAGDAREFVHSQLDTCLESDFWKGEALHRMADKRVRPLKAVGRDGDIILADYEWDYRLFSYILSGDRDARDLLLADYHVNEDGEVETGRIGRDADGAFPPADGQPILIGSGQPLRPENRAGMITTQWYLVVNTMFSTMPRTTAAQAYRSYVGLDIAKGQGIMPVEGEPRDVDNKGVQNPTCAACHSTLDPLAYAFSAYDGIRIDPVAQVLFGSNNTGTFDDGRTEYTGDGSLFNTPVPDLLSWAQMAANSDQFKRNLAEMFFQQALGVDPGPADHEELTAVWQALPNDGYSANRLIHRIVDTAAFGVP
jgi:hypothetical protein